jgi:hypothetical protein
MSRDEDRRGNPAVGSRRDTKGQLGHSGHHSRGGTHEHARRVERPSAGCVEAGSLNGADQLVYEHHSVVEGVLSPICLVAVVGDQPLPGELQGSEECLRDLARRRLELAGWDREHWSRHAVQKGGQLDQSLVATSADLLEDLSDSPGYLAPLWVTARPTGGCRGARKGALECV